MIAAPAAGYRIIEAYGDGGFTIAGQKHSGSILVFPRRVAPWSITNINDISLDNLTEIFRQDPDIELLLVGCGAVQIQPSAALRHGLSEAQAAVDFMNTGAACRTFNVLLAEDRRVAAALIAV